MMPRMMEVGGGGANERRQGGRVAKQTEEDQLQPSNNAWIDSISHIEAVPLGENTIYIESKIIIT